MESRLQRFLLTLSLVLSLCFSLPLTAQEENEDDNRTILDGVINPDLERRKIDESKIDSENFELGFYGGVLSVEDFGTNASFGATIAYHISEDWFIEAGAGTTELSATSFEVLSGTNDLIDPEDRDLNYYNLSIGLNLFPGEFFIGKSRAFNMSGYVIAGAGNTKFAGDEFFTLNYGMGIRLSATDWLAVRIGFRNHIFTHDVFGVDKSVQNLEPQIGLSLYF